MTCGETDSCQKNVEMRVRSSVITNHATAIHSYGFAAAADSVDVVDASATFLIFVELRRIISFLLIGSIQDFDSSIIIMSQQLAIVYS